MGNKKCIGFFHLKKLHFIYLFLLLIVISFTNCIIEIPLQTVEVKGGWKYKNIKLEEPDEYPKDFNKTILISDGAATLNRNYLFLGTVYIGQYNQKFNLVLDTGSYIAWVAGYGSDDQYTINNHFNTRYSTSTGQEFEQKYETGYCKGYYYRDNFAYIKNSYFPIKFGVADQTQLEVDQGDGIIGLGHYYPDESLSFIHMLKKARITDSLLFSFKFEDRKNTGKLYIGKHSDFSQDNAVTCPLLTFQGMSNIYWVCEVSGIGLRNNNYDVRSSRSFDNIIFDTGTNFILLPLKVYNDIKDSLNKFGCGAKKNGKYISLYCSSKFDNLPNLTLDINGHTLIVPREKLYSYSSSYYSSEITFADSNIYILGSPFFLSFHTLFNKEDELLHFYPLKPEYLEKGSTSVAAIIGIILVILFLLLILGCLIRQFLKWKRARDENDFPSSNYNFNFI